MNKSDLDTHIHMGCRTIDDSYKYNWQLQDMKNFKIPKNKTFLVFGGNTTNYAEAANGNAKIVETLLSPENRKKSNIYSFIYDGEPICSVTKTLLPEYEEEMHQYFEKIIKPLLVDKFGNVKEKQGIEKALKNLVFVSHCAGSLFVNVIIEDIYKTLLKKYHPSIADHLINKLQFYSYAPYELPSRDVNGFIISPFFDDDFGWEKILIAVSDQKISNDHPKCIMKKISKATNQGNVFSTFNEIYDQERMVLFRSEQSIFAIPSRINPNTNIGDHSIDCIVKKSVLDSNSDFAETAKILNHASRLVLNQFASEETLDYRTLFTKMVSRISESPVCKPDNNLTDI